MLFLLNRFRYWFYPVKYMFKPELFFVVWNGNFMVLLCVAPQSLYEHTFSTQLALRANHLMQTIIMWKPLPMQLALKTIISNRFTTNNMDYTNRKFYSLMPLFVGCICLFCLFVCPAQRNQEQPNFQPIRVKILCVCGICPMMCSFSLQMDVGWMFLTSSDRRTLHYDILL